MGVSIRAIKPIEFIADLNTELSDEQWDSGAKSIYTLDFSPIKHLTKFKEGVYKCLDICDTSLDLAYSGYGRFRKAVCAPIHGDWEEYLEKIDNGSEPCNGAFAEFLYFADNEGCFDYAIAGKLLKDFKDYRDIVYPTLNSDHQSDYNQYTQILRECVACGGVVFYS